jgi:hypothetical protein
MTMHVQVRQRPPIVPAGPLDLGHILGGPFRLIRFATAVTVGFPIAAVLIGIGLTALLFLALGLDHPQHWITVVSFFVIVCPLWAGLALTTIAASFAALDHAVRGERIGVAAALSVGVRRAPGLAWLCLMVLVVVLLIGAAGMLPMFLSSLVGSADRSFWFFVPVLMLSMFCAIGVVTYLHVALITAGPIYVVEGVGVWAALSAALEQVRGNWWRTFGILLLANLLLNVVPYIAMIPAALVVMAVSTASTWAGYVVGGLWAAVVLGCVSAFSTGVVGLLHYDQRARSRLRM